MPQGLAEPQVRLDYKFVERKMLWLRKPGYLRYGQISGLPEVIPKGRASRESQCSL